MSFFENFQNFRRKFVNSSFDWKFYTEKLFNRTFLITRSGLEIWRNILFYNVIIEYDVISSHVIFIENVTFYSFLTRNFKKWQNLHDNLEILLINDISIVNSKSKLSLHRSKRLVFREKNCKDFIINDGVTDKAFIQPCNFYFRKFKKYNSVVVALCLSCLV